MSNKRPLCDCGHPLKLVFEIVTEREQVIKRDGTLGTLVRNHPNNESPNGNCWLECDSCSKEYEYDLLINGQIVRKEER